MNLMLQNGLRLDARALFEYWCYTYENILRRTVIFQERKVVLYEELIATPRTVTKDLFTWIGSEQKEGLDRPL